MRLSRFILANKERILRAWEEFFRPLPPGYVMNVAALRDDAERMLGFIARDIDTEQTDDQPCARALGYAR